MNVNQIIAELSRKENEARNDLIESYSASATGANGEEIELEEAS
jgi:hypothetical protein